MALYVAQKNGKYWHRGGGKWTADLQKAWIYPIAENYVRPPHTKRVRVYLTTKKPEGGK